MHKIAAIFMAMVVLFSTMSFSVGMHYCGDMLVDTALFAKANSCGMQMDQPNENVPKDCSTVKKDCCNDIEIAINGQHDLQPTQAQINFNQQLFVASFVIAYSNLFTSPTNTLVSYVAYSPPLVVKDIQKLDETYLI